MIKKRFLIILAICLAIAGLTGVTWVTLASSPCTTTIPAGGDIQAAINASSPGDVICLQPGVYSPPAKIQINKSVTIQGPQVGVDPRPSAGSSRSPGDPSTEAIIDGAAANLSGIIVILADNVILDGLQVRNGSGDLIDSEDDLATSGTTLRNLIINHATGDEAIQLRYVLNGVIEYNYIFDIAQDGINMCCGSSGGLVQQNEVTDNNSENAAIYIYGATNMTIKCNLVYDVNGNDGIKLGTKGGSDALLSGGWILYNTVHDTAQDSISVYMSDTHVEGNEVYNSTSENGAIYLAWGISNVQVTLNDLHNNTLNPGKWGDPGAVMIGSAVNSATVSVTNNNIYDNSVNGVTNKAAEPLNAVTNWWGAADGPSGVGSGSGDGVSTNVNYDPWLAAPVSIPDVCTPNQPPDCDNAYPSQDSIWPPNHKFVPIQILGLTDPDGDPVMLSILSIYQDEPVDTNGDGAFTPDGYGVGTSTAWVRAERAGGGNGRVYRITFLAEDGQGGYCNGVVSINVPHDEKKAAVDDGALYDSTIP